MAGRRRKTTGYGVRTLRGRLEELAREMPRMMDDGRIFTEEGVKIHALLSQAVAVCWDSYRRWENGERTRTGAGDPGGDSDSEG